ncbi:MAG TPA: heme biosynthesis HemY N-terminal domain-containing protein [Thiobacillaceae bacterium]|nr:heme biosynthesis HemY N-terminal domain-containing protein [Thiobacillaceae bacterium]
MRWLLTLLILATAAAGLALAGRYDPGYAVLVFRPWRIELSFITLVILLGLLGLLAYWLTRLTVATLQLPESVRAHREKIRREQACLELENAFQAYLEGRNQDAEKLAAGYSGNDKQTGLARVIAARAAQEIRATGKRDAYLAQATQGKTALAAYLFEAETRLKERDASTALTAISRGRALAPNHTALTRLELRARQMLGQWEETLRLAEQLSKANALDQTTAAQTRHRAQLEIIRRKSGDPAALQAFWKKLSAEDKTYLPSIQATAAAFMKSGDSDTARELLERSLAAEWQEELLPLYAQSGSQPLRQIERAEAWLRDRPRDAALLLALAQLCAREELWGKAQSYLEASLALSPTTEAHMAMAEISQKAGKIGEACAHYRQALELCRAAKGLR